MSSRIVITSLLIPLLCTFILVSSSPTNVYGTAQPITFLLTPSGYNELTGAFELTRQITDNAGNGAVCMMYDYFIINMRAGQVLQGGLQTAGMSKTVYYMVLNSPGQLFSFMNSNCGVRTPYWPNIAPTIASWRPYMAVASSINWTAPTDGQYALVFMVYGFYGGVLHYFP